MGSSEKRFILWGGGGGGGGGGRLKASEERMGVYLPPQDSLNTEKTDEFTSTCKILFNM